MEGDTTRRSTERLVRGSKESPEGATRSHRRGRVMHVDFHILNEAAKQLRETVGNSIPLEPRGWPAEDLQLLREVLYELNWGDLMDALRAAAERLPDPVLEEDDEVSEPRSGDKSDLGGSQ